MTTTDATPIVRFGSARMIEHHLNALIFALLVTTGLSQKFYDADLSRWIIGHLGGVDNARLIHRSSGVVFSILCMAHILTASAGVFLKRWPATMVITVDDFKHAIHNLRYYFGMVNEPARCGRYDYKQKFEYWGVVVGGLLMITTGILLWFPVMATSFLPGEFIPAAKAAHTNEAMLAFLVIVIWHVYNSIFSPEVFPLDTAIFTGTISRQRMLHEHPLELADREGRTVEDLLRSHHHDPFSHDAEPHHSSRN